jgi:hypothetical protein
MRNSRCNGERGGTDEIRDGHPGPTRIFSWTRPTAALRARATRPGLGSAHRGVLPDGEPRGACPRAAVPCPAPRRRGGSAHRGVLPGGEPGDRGGRDRGRKVDPKQRATAWLPPRLVERGGVASLWWPARRGRCRVLVGPVGVVASVAGRRGRRWRCTWCDRAGPVGVVGEFHPDVLGAALAGRVQEALVRPCGQVRVCVCQSG